MTKKVVKKDSLRIPQVCSDRDYDCVYLKGQKIYLGRSGTPEAEAAYRQLQIKILSDPSFSFLNSQQITIDCLCLAYLEHAKEFDSSHYYSVKTAVEILLRNFGGQAADSLDSRHFLILQDKFVEHGASRQYCNMLMVLVRMMLKWGAVRKMVSPLVLAEAKLVPALRKGKTHAKENPPRKDVPDEVINRTLPHLLPTIRDMVQIHRATTMRSKEVCIMKVGEIDMEYVTPDGVNIWLYTPGIRKNDWREGYDDFPIPLGKLEQEILGPRLVGLSDDDYVFSPRDTEQERRERDAAKRKSKVPPSQIRRKERNARKPKRERTRYSSESYNQAITYAIEAANKKLPKGEAIPHWTAYQLRHTAITDTALRTGSRDVARACAGQKTLKSTLNYDHSDFKVAVNQAVERSR